MPFDIEKVCIAVNHLRKIGYTDDKICIYLTKKSIMSIVRQNIWKQDVVIDFADENMRFEGILVKIHFENKVVGIMDEVKV